MYVHNKRIGSSENLAKECSCRIILGSCNSQRLTVLWKERWLWLTQFKGLLASRGKEKWRFFALSIFLLLNKEGLLEKMGKHTKSKLKNRTWTSYFLSSLCLIMIKSSSCSEEGEWSFLLKQFLKLENILHILYLEQKLKHYGATFINLCKCLVPVIILRN